jgi:hypothetical protein
VDDNSNDGCDVSFCCGYFFAGCSDGGLNSMATSTVALMEWKMISMMAAM